PLTHPIACSKPRNHKPRVQFPGSRPPRLILVPNRVQSLVAQCRQCDSTCIVHICLASSAGIEHAHTHGEGGRYVDDVFSVGEQYLCDTAPQSLGAFDGETPLGPSV
ncbi:hypothetical protein ABTZ46_27660, partial [Nocardioides sp. NPDC126508]